jgi:hypothetical protein
MPDLESSRATPNSGHSPGAHHGYDPNQPRVPSGHGDGGQWTKTGGGTPTIARREAVVDHGKQESWGSYVDGYRADGSLAEQRVFNRDRSRIISEFKPPDDPGDWDERHIVVLPEGQKFTFENSGNVQRIFDGEGNLVSLTEWTDDGPRPLPTGESAFLGPAISAGANIASRLGPAAAQALNAAALTFFTWLSSRKDPNRTAVFAFNAKKYEKPGTEENEKRPVVFVGSLTRDEVRTACKKFGKVQKITDDAVAKVTADGDYKGPTDFGTKVHKEIARVINDKNNPNFRAEQSVIKSALEGNSRGSTLNTDNAQEDNNKSEARYGQLGSIRMDAYENIPDKSTVCVYDPKTGWRGLSFPRMNELAAAAHRLFGYTPRYIIVTEVRPGQH